MSRIVWSILAPFCVVLAVLAVVTMVRENTGSDPSAAQAAEGEAPTVSPTVSMEGTAFAPGDLTVARGAEIIFDNDDVAPHTVTADDGSIDSGILDPGKAFKLVADRSFSYHCEVHPSMKAEVRLEG